MTAAKPIEDQPTEAQEVANAAYVWRKNIQTELLGVMRDPAVKIETAEWWFERYLRAYRREIELHEAVREDRA